MREFLTLNPGLHRQKWLLLLLFAILPPVHADKIDFNHQIKPILSDRCFVCHGPDEKSRKAKLRLDTRDGAYKTLEDGKAIIKPGNASASELLRRITTTDQDDLMPPPDSNLSLAAEEKNLLKQWIDQGAEWQEHWAFRKIQKPATPTVQASAWIKNPIDTFVLSKLEKQGISPAPEADKERLLRRVTFDLTGLPPTLEEMDNFHLDTAANAYEKAVSRLLNTRAYGERMATEWLDVARYADTHGYQADRYRATWPWRDWVIEKFNQNLPFDQFITWQLAGDLLPEATKEQRLATAFNRLHMQTEEGGSVEEEFRVSYVTDRVNTAGTAFMALTFECARCHDHKYDPMPQKDFYRLYSFFNNIDESGQTSHFTDSMPVPTLLLSDEKTERSMAAAALALKSVELEKPALLAESRHRFAQWLSHRPGSIEIPGKTGDFDFDSVTNKLVLNQIDPTKPGTLLEDPKILSSGGRTFLSLSGENGIEFKGLAPFKRSDPFSFALWVRIPTNFTRAVVFHRSKAGLDAGSRGYEMLIENGRLSFGLIHMWPHNALKVTTKSTLPLNRWIHIGLTYDGSSSANGLKLFIDGAMADRDTIRDNLFKDITYERNPAELTLGQRFRDNGFKGGEIDDFQVFERALSTLEISQLAGSLKLSALLKTPRENLSANDLASLWEFYHICLDKPVADYLGRLKKSRLEKNEVYQSIPEHMVMEEMTKPRPAFVLRRGAYDAPGDPVTAGTPGFLPAMPDSYPKNRLGLARWLLNDDQPLTARVTVNRYWQILFGKGIVESADNFGSQGSLPSHPELLDWLSQSFIGSGWDLKQLIQLLVTSNTYRQSSQPTAAALEKDPGNRWFSRAPRRRLNAEMLRDHALSSSGLLVQKVGGPSVKPYQPEGLWEEKSGARYEQDKGEGSYRRSLYTFWKRTSPHPMMVTFDASDRNYCLAKRQSTSTPLQSLVLLNDTQFVEAARVLAERMLYTGKNLQDQLSTGYRLLTSRHPKPEELQVLKRLFQEQSEFYQKNPELAEKVKLNGAHTSATTFSSEQLAAMTAVANVLMNFEESVTLR